ncbi:MAG: aquaporin [Alphaproteobacteria bacterium]
MKKYVAEITGTFILTLAVILSLNGLFPVPTPVIAGLALGFGVYTLGGVSGAHFNPAITLGVLSIGKISTTDAMLYICSQLIGAAGAAELARRVIIERQELIITESNLVMLAEMLGAMIFSVGVAAAVYNRVTQGASGIVVGGALLLGISVAAVASNGVLNPAVALGIGSFSFSYLFGPIVGAVLGMLFYKNLTQ